MQHSQANVPALSDGTASLKFYHESSFFFFQFMYVALLLQFLESNIFLSSKMGKFNCLARRSLLITL